MQSIKYRNLLIIICLLLFFWMTGCALQTPASPAWTPLNTTALEGQLTLSRCLELAKANDIKAVQWKARLDVAGAGIRGAKIIPNPSLGISWEDIGLTDDLGKGISSVTYGISYPILFWWPYAEKVKAAKINQQAEEAAVLSEQRRLEIEIASAYFNIVAGQRKAALAGDIAAGCREAYRLALKQNQLNEISGLSLDQSRLEMLKAESDLKEAQNTLAADRISFSFALGADRPFYPILLDCGNEYLHPKGISADKESLTETELEAAIDNIPDYREKQIAVEYAASKLRIERLNAIPLSDVSGTAERKDSPEGDSSNYGLEIPIPLFDRNQAGIESANADLRTAQADLEQARREAIAEIITDWQQYCTLAWKWGQYASGSTQLADKNSKTAERLYEMGRITYSELLQDQHDCRDAQMEAVDTWRDLSTVAWTLSRKLGKD